MPGGLHSGELHTLAGMNIRNPISTVTITPLLRRAGRSIVYWNVPVALIAAAACLVAGVSLPILVVREFFVYGQSLSILDGVCALLGKGDWQLATVLVLFSIVVPLVKIGMLLMVWCRARQGRVPRSWVLTSLEWSGKWAMLDVFIVALVIVVMNAHILIDAHVAEAVYPFVAAIGLTTYAARAVAYARHAPKLT